jgi:hypothetical protein
MVRKKEKVKEISVEEEGLLNLVLYATNQLSSLL